MIKTKEIIVSISLILAGYLIAKMFSSICEKFTVSSQSNSENDKSSKSSKLWIWIWIVSVIALLGIGIVIYTFYNKEKNMVVTAELTSDKMTTTNN
jgi:uncharacterized membrane protein YjgN (DUF898 family)